MSGHEGVHGLILAGGRGSRLGGVRKATLRIGGEALIARVAARLGGVTRPLLVSTGREQMRFDDIGESIADLPTGLEGPMAGLLAGAQHLNRHVPSARIMVSVAVDTPFLPPDFVARLVIAMGPGQAAFARWAGTSYPTNAAWRLDVLAGLAERALWEPVEASPRRLLHDMEAVAVDWTGQEANDPFANLNTLADLVSLGRRAAAER